MATQVKLATPIQADNLPELLKVVSDLKAEIETCINANPMIASGSGVQGFDSSKIGKTNDIIIGYNSTTNILSIGLKLSANKSATFSLNAVTEYISKLALTPSLKLLLTGFVGFVTKTSNPATTDFTADGQFGIFQNTTAVTWYFAMYDATTNSVKKVALT